MTIFVTFCSFSVSTSTEIGDVAKTISVIRANAEQTARALVGVDEGPRAAMGEARAAGAAIIALIHDLIITVGIYALVVRGARPDVSPADLFLIASYPLTLAA